MTVVPYIGAPSELMGILRRQVATVGFAAEYIPVKSGFVNL